MTLIIFYRLTKNRHPPVNSRNDPVNSIDSYTYRSENKQTLQEIFDGIPPSERLTLRRFPDSKWRLHISKIAQSILPGNLLQWAGFSDERSKKFMRKLWLQ